MRTAALACLASAGLVTATITATSSPAGAAQTTSVRVAQRTAGMPVVHIMAPHKIEPATLTPNAQQLPNGTLVYRA